MILKHIESSKSRQASNLQQYGQAILGVAMCTGVASLMHGHIDHANVIMVYLLGVVWTAARCGRGPAILASIASVAIIDFLFVRPYFSFAVSESAYLIIFPIMIVTSVLIGAMTSRIRKQAEETIALSKQAEAERLRSTLLSSVSHDLRTPLATITGAASSVLQSGGIERSDLVELIQVIYEEANRMDSFISNLLSMTRLESGNVQIKKEWQPIEEVVGSALARMEERLGARRVCTDLPADLPLVPLDAILVEQVFINLLDNAIKNSTEHDTITISAQRRNDDLVVTVSDTGSGIAASDREKIFEKFYQSPTRANQGGSGLGLSICKGVVTVHGGRIWVEENIPRGCSVKFSLPLGDTVPSITSEVMT